MAGIDVKCLNCGKSISYNCGILEWECVGSEDRNMGLENLYRAAINDMCACGRPISIIFTCAEYPVGAENVSEVEYDGVYVIGNDCATCIDFNNY